MERWLGRHGERAYALLRVVSGALFACHGAQKLFGAFGGPVTTSQPLLLAAALIELCCGAAVALGLLTSWAAFLASGEMAVAYFLVHAPRGPWPILNQGELAALYCFIFLHVAARGSGPYGLDVLWRARRGA
jgi:putative oxidoreductase